MADTLISTYSGDTFKNLIRAYSNDRMSRDPRYRREVHKAVSARKAAKKPKDAKEAVTGG